MTPFTRRIARQPAAAQAAMGAYHPVADQPSAMPVVRVVFGDQGAIVEEMVPLYLAGARQNAPLPAAWAAPFDQQLAAAGSRF